MSVNLPELFGAKRARRQENPTFVFLIGSPGVGKSTRAKQIVGEALYNTMYRVSLDRVIEDDPTYCAATHKLHITLRNKRKMEKPESNKMYGKKSYELFEKAYLTRFMKLRTKFDKAIEFGIENGFSVLYDTTFDLNRSDRVTKYDNILKQIARYIFKQIENGKEIHYTVRVILLHPEGNETQQVTRIQKQLYARLESMIKGKCIRPVNPYRAHEYIKNNQKAYHIISQPEYTAELNMNEALRLIHFQHETHVVTFPEHVAKMINAYPALSMNSNTNSSVRSSMNNDDEYKEHDEFLFMPEQTEDKLPIKDGHDDIYAPTLTASEMASFSTVKSSARATVSKKRELLGSKLVSVPLNPEKDAKEAKKMKRNAKTLRQKTRKAAIAEIVKNDMVRWLKGTPVKMDQHYVDKVERSLVVFFREGYDKYFNKENKALDFDEIYKKRQEKLNREIKEDEEDPIHHAPDAEVIAFIKEIVKKYGLKISGGYILKNTGLSGDDSSKPSVDIDIYVPYQTPDREPDFYQVMARLFNCDYRIDRTGRKRAACAPYVTATAHETNRKFFFKKNGIYSVHKYKRNEINKKGDHPSKIVYAEMDLVRCIDGNTPMNLIKNFDLTVCMNWYDGESIYAMDFPAITNKKEHTGHLSQSYVPLLLGLKGDKGRKPEMNPTTRGRVLKYIMRGYRVSYVDPRTGETNEIQSRELPNAIYNLDHNKREKYYLEHPNERDPRVPIGMPRPEIEKKVEIVIENNDAIYMNNTPKKLTMKNRQKIQRREKKTQERKEKNEIHYQEWKKTHKTHKTPTNSNSMYNTMHSFI